MSTTSKKEKIPINAKGKPDKRGYIPMANSNRYKPKAIIANYFDVEKELELVAEPRLVKTTNKSGKEEMQVQLITSGNVFSGYSIEEVLQKGYGTTTKYWEYYKSTAVLRKCINMIANFTTRNGFETTIKCLNEKDDPERPEYKEIKRKIDELNRQVNMDNVLRITQIKRYIYGNCGWAWTTSAETDDIMRLDPLNSSYIIPVVNEKTGEFTGINYSYAQTGVIPKERLLYFTIDTIEDTATSYCGVSACRSCERNVKIKKNLERDLLYASRSLWAPIVIYNVDTRGLTSTEEATLFATLKSDLKPGAVIIVNRAVESTVIQYSPDLNNLIRAIDKQDEEIIGNFGIPKALLSREKTMARATLEFSIRAFYESTIAGEQAYLKRELEAQWYDPLVESMGFGDKIRIRHEWKPIIDPQSDLIVALVRAYEAGIVNMDEFWRRLGWELDRIPGAEPVQTPPTGEKPERKKPEEEEPEEGEENE